VASLEPEELKAMVKAYEILLALSGDGEKCQVTVKQNISIAEKVSI
jgi:sialic acid synthase SpsE